MTPFIPVLSSSEGSGYESGSTSAGVGDGVGLSGIPRVGVEPGCVTAHPASSIADATMAMTNPRAFMLRRYPMLTGNVAA